MCLFLFLMVYSDYVQLSQIMSICRKQTSPFAFNLLNLAHLIEININSKEIRHGTSNFHLQHFKSHCQSAQYTHACMCVIILTFSPATILRPTLLFPFFYNLWNSKVQHSPIREYLSSVFTQTLLAVFDDHRHFHCHVWLKVFASKTFKLQL